MTIFILGMHRSGTSAVAATIAAMDAYAGAAQDMLPATADNPQGFGERKDVLAVNQMILKSQYCNWYTVSHFDSRSPIAEGLQMPIRACLSELKPHAPFVVKDPRFCLTLPYWLPHIHHAPVVVLVRRHPSSIANSLWQRNQMPLTLGLALWEEYISRALGHIQELPIIPIDYEALIAEPETTTKSLHQALQAYIPDLSLPDKVPIDPSLAHPHPHTAPLTPSQKALWEKLRAVQY